MKTKYVVEINHRAMNERSLYERVRNALFQWHGEEPMVRSVSVLPQPAQPQKAEERSENGAKHIKAKIRAQADWLESEGHRNKTVVSRKAVVAFLRELSAVD